jgi:ABC-2 type transport system permease protein
MSRRTLAIMRKEMLHIIRDPRTLAVIFLIPIIQMVLMGYAATTDIDNIRLAVLDGDRSAESRALVQAYDTTGYFKVSHYVDSEEQMAHLLDSGNVRAALIIPTVYGQRVTAGERVEVGVIIDGSDPTVANGVLAAALQTGQEWAASMIDLGFEGGGLEIRPTVWYNPGLESVNYMIPALMGLIMQFLATLVTSMAIVREREYGTIEQLISTPIKPVELVVGKTIPYILVTYFGMIEVMVVAVFWFGVPIYGSLLLLLGLSALFLLGSLGIGIVISTVAGTQQEAMLLSFLILVPSIFLSGFFFPLEAMPWALRLMSHFIPLRYMLIIIRGIVLKGVGISTLHTEVIFLAVFCVIMLFLASVRFRKNLG